MENSELVCLNCPEEVIEELEEAEGWKADETLQDSTATETVYEYKAVAAPKKDGVNVRPELKNDTITKVVDTIN